MNKKKIYMGTVFITIMVICGMIYVNTSSTVKKEFYINDGLNKDKVEDKIEDKETNSEDKLTEENSDYINDLKKEFQEIKPNEYTKRYEEINDIMLKVVEGEQDLTFAIETLEMLLKNDRYLSNKVKMSTYINLAGLYILDLNYIKATEINLDAIEFSYAIKDEYYIQRNKVDLAIIAKSLGGQEIAKSILETVTSEGIKEDRLKVKLDSYRLLNLAELSLELKENDNAIACVEEVESYGDNISEAERHGIYSLINLVKAEAYINKGDIEKAEKYFNSAKEILEADKSYLYVEKDIYYNIVSANLNRAQGNYDIAIKGYEDALNILKVKENMQYNKMCIEGLVDIYMRINKYEEAVEYNNILINAEKTKNSLIGNEYFNYIIQKYNAEKQNIRNEYIQTTSVVLGILFIISIGILYEIHIKKALVCRKKRKIIRENLEKNNYELYYQPIINPKNNTIRACEALLRLKIDGKIIMPNIIIKDIEECDMMGEVSVWILKKVINDFNAIKSMDNLSHKFYLSMNISLNEVENDEIFNSFKNIISNSGLGDKSICLEITENAAGKNSEKIKNNMKELIEAGFIIAVDDFGVEYSNISVLEKFDFNVIKVDKCFIDNINTSIVNRTVIDIVDYISNKLDINIVIEGVETLEQIEYIRNLSSTKFYIQGYYYSKPVEIDELQKFVI